MHSLVTRLRELFPPAPAMGAPINGDVVTSVTETLQSVKLNPREWQQHAVYRRGRYTRNIVGYSPNQFIVLLLCWERGQQSPIHDHAGAHCFIKMLSGQLQERKFAWAPNGSSGAQAGPPGLLDASDTEKSARGLKSATESVWSQSRSLLGLDADSKLSMWVLCPWTWFPDRGPCSQMQSGSCAI
ncbi:CDO1 [Symbiodinium sp. CCMP2456]|nr:CDO1 [Symbiodinium sp. CCMP2456]